MLYFMETPLTDIATIFEGGTTYDEYGEATYTKKEVEALFFRENKRVLNFEGIEVTSNTCLIIKDEIVNDSYILKGTTTEIDPKLAKARKLQSISEEVDILDNTIQGYSVYL